MSNGKLTKNFNHICWDGCMFPNETMMKPETWNDILARDDRRARSSRLEMNNREREHEAT